MSDLDQLNYNETRELVLASIKANQPITVEGPPGVGKTAMIYEIGKKLKMKVVVLILSQCEPTDVGGFPVVDMKGGVDRHPLGPIKQACDEPVVLFLDELTTAPPAVQGAALRLIYERWAGDRELHPGTRIVAAQNPPEQAAGGWEMALPLIGRMAKVKMKPELKEIQDFFYQLGEDASTLRALAADFAATAEVDPKLIQLDPPRGASATGSAWGAPRSWERAVKTCAVLLDDGCKDTGHVFAAALAGSVGQDSATAFMMIRKVRDNLPGVEEILRAPDKARLPANVETAIAAIGVLMQVAIKDPCAAHVYADRLTADVKAAAGQALLKGFKFKEYEKTSPWYKQAYASVATLIREHGRAMRTDSSK